MQRVSRVAAVWLAAFLCGVGSGAPPAAGTAQLRVENARVTQPPPGADVAAAYFTLHNAGADPQVLSGISSPAADAAMLHETRLDHGIERMRPVERLQVAPGQAIVLRPGALHVMLHGLHGELRVGQSLLLVLHFAGGGELEVNAVIQPIGSQ